MLAQLKTLAEGFVRALNRDTEEDRRMEDLRNYSGHPELFDKLVECGCDPMAFNQAAARFQLSNPDGDFAKAVDSLRQAGSGTERFAMAMELFGRAGREIATYAD